MSLEYMSFYLARRKKYSCRVIPKKANISKSSVSLILRKNGKRKHYLKRNDKIGRPHKLTERDRRKLIRSIQTLRHDDPNFTVKQLLAESGLLSQEVSYRTIYRQVQSARFQFLPGVVIECSLTPKITRCPRDHAWTPRTVHVITTHCSRVQP